MLDHNQGLRFDVYERVHLSDEAAAIDELEEIELTPHIEIVDQQEQVLLRGNLLLSGIYRSQEAEEARQLEYWIPVEITLPMNRVERLEDLAVDIDNFDVDLLSSRTLSITGVLSLRGLVAEEQPAYAGWEPEQEAFTVVTRVEQPTEEVETPGDSSAAQTLARAEGPSRPFAPPESPLHIAQEPASSERRQQPEEPQAALAPKAEPPVAEEPTRAPEKTAELPQAEPAVRPVTQPASFNPPLPPAPAEQPVARTPSAELHEPLEATKVETQPSSAGGEQEPVSWAGFTEADEREKLVQAGEPEPVAAEEDPLAEATVEEAPPKPEMKIAFAGKRPEADDSEHVGLKSLLTSGRREAEARQQAQQAAEAEELPPADVPSGDEVEWKRLFLSKTGEETEFRKIRMCIVQREETLEEIAERYQLGSREIVLYNRLPDHSVTEGQVLHIP
ncbi:LysM peptidoglycan-binding domain-containing protein [Paenibacillus sp. 1P07SE]|uniref:LysM peptidoglycan-binding domain-containing protein n=1 Tax=Paenibacillus sp. 1P07SE TaxID=3132209 RepID=UPI0039A6CC44